MPPIPIEARRRHTAANLAALTLANAFIFQEELAQADSRVEPIRRLMASRDFHTATANYWEFICDTINYVPIFHLARQVLLAIPSNAENASALCTLAQQTLEIVSERAALRHDLMGRIYHYLLLEAKYLGTFYTSVPAATLLLKLALAPEAWNIDWSNSDSLRNFVVADLACGTGTLLMAASQGITDNFIRASVRKGNAIDGMVLRRLHQIIMEDVLHGYDVLPSAVHLTASTLALLAPEIAFRKMQLYSLPLGKLADGSIFLGSIDYLDKDSVQTQLDMMGTAPTGGAAAALSGSGTSASIAPLPPLDLCVMNPPFVRSVNKNLLFGSLPQHRTEMQRELSRRLRAGHQGTLATTTAGLGSIFTAIGDRHLKEHGRLALVIPAAITTGGAWAKTRAIFDNKYDLEFVVASHDVTRWAFSESAKYSDVLVVARKRGIGEQKDLQTACTFINLWRNPAATADALALGESISGASIASVGDGDRPSHGVTPLNIGGEKWGEAISIPLADLYLKPWVGCAFAHTELVRANWHLRQGRLVLPGASRMHAVPLCRLDSLAVLGPDGRDIHDGFARTRSETAFAAFWNHDADHVQTIDQEPNEYLSPRPRAAPNRPKRPAHLLWPKAGQVLVAVRLRFNTHRLTAIRVRTPVLSNTWYPVKFLEEDQQHEKALLLWLNSTLGILLLAGHRVPTQGAWVQFKKPTWNPMPVLDVKNLGPSELRGLAGAFDRLRAETLGPIHQMDQDPVRDQIDGAIAAVLGFPSIAPLRSLLAHEPVVCNAPMWTGGTAVGALEMRAQFDLLLPEIGPTPKN